jgi:hypothetical protein
MGPLSKVKQNKGRVFTPPSLHALFTESGEPDHKENDMTDTAKKPIDDSKEELTEAELDQVAGGIGAFGVAMDEKTSTLPAAPGKIREGFTSPSGSLPA